MSSINSICVCGAGTMGAGIALVTASAGLPTILYDLNEQVLEKARVRIDHDLDYQVQKQKISISRKEEIINTIRFTSLLRDCQADLIVEAVVERMDVKTALFNQLAELNSPSAIFATNTSSLSITRLAEHTGIPERIAGLHFFNPAAVMKLVEVVKGKKTSENVINQLTAFARQLGKVPVICMDAPGFIVNRVARPYYIESLRLVEEARAGYATIDRLMESRGFRMGPFRLMDLIGNDVNFAVSSSVYEQLNQPERLKPSIIQKEKVDKGELGRKTGKGYYGYQISEKS